MLFGFGRGLDVSDAIVKKNFQLEEKIKKLSDKVAKFSADRAVDVPVLNGASGAENENEKGESLQSNESKSSQVKSSDLYNCEEKSSKFSFLISGVKGVCRWCYESLVSIPGLLCKWYIKELVFIPIFIYTNCRLWDILKSWAPVGNIFKGLNEDINNFEDMCKRNLIEDCNRVVLSEEKARDRRKENLLNNMLGVNVARWELLKQYICHKLGLKWYHNPGFGTK